MDEKDNKVVPELKQEPIVKKAPMRSRVVSAIIAEEARDVKEYLIFDVIIPTIKQTLFDLVTNALNLTLFGKPNSSMNRDRDRGPYVSYSSYSSSRGYDKYEREERTRDRRDRYEKYVDIRHLDRVEFRYREDAVDVINFLEDNLNEFGYATVADFLSAAHLETNSVHNKWGWYDIGKPTPQQLSNGRFYVKLPKPRPID